MYYNSHFSYQITYAYDIIRHLISLELRLGLRLGLALTIIIRVQVN